MSELNRLEPAARYHRDPMFAAMVNNFRSLIAGGEFTPTEIREACIYAATMVEERRECTDRRYLDGPAAIWRNSLNEELTGFPPSTRRRDNHDP